MRRAAQEAKKTETSKQFQFTPSTMYLLFYNAAQAVGWTVLTGKIIWHCSFHDSYVGLYDEVKLFLNIFQTAAVLEVIHIVVRIVRSNPVMTAAQVMSRLFLTWGILWLVPESRSQVGVLLMMLAWCIAEVIRYCFYTMALVGDVSYFIQWARYTLFIVLYPVGVLGELLCIYCALPYVRHRGTLSISLPNAANFGFDYSYMMVTIMLSYIPFFPQLYMHMLAQRRKIIGGEEQLSKRE